MSGTLPEGHPLPWDELVPYEQDQGGYWATAGIMTAGRCGCVSLPRSGRAR